MNPDIERGSDYQFQEGYPDVRLSALGYLNIDDDAIIDVTTDIGFGSLIYRTVNNKTIAVIELAIRVVNTETGIAENILREFEIEAETETYLINQEVFTYTEEVKTEPGNYAVLVSVNDKTSGKEIIRQTEAYIPDPGDPVNNLTAIRLSGKNMETVNPQFIPVTTYNVTASNDSLKFEFQVTNNDANNPLTVTSTLKYFPADLDPAISMSERNHAPNTLPAKGIDFRDAEIKDETTRTLEQPGSVLIEFKYPLLEKGNYRFEVTTTTHDGDQLYKARDFAIRNKNYPSVITSRELAEPLIYLMGRGEYNRMMALSDPDSIKEVMDRFWLNHLGSMRDARDVISKYYTRVETANKLYTNFKEGWKTDRGMMYILYGPPWYIESERNSLVWSYTYNLNDSERNFHFTRFRRPNEFFPFNHYILERNSNFHQLEYRQRQLWLTGAVLQRNL